MSSSAGTIRSYSHRRLSLRLGYLGLAIPLAFLLLLLAVELLILAPEHEHD